MFGVIPVTLTDVRKPVGTSRRGPWTTEDFHHWLDPSRPFSLTHYWQTASWGTFDLRYRLSEPVRMKDPRRSLPADSTNETIRPHLTKEVVAEANRQVGFVGDGLHGVMLFFTCPCDLFGGAATAVPLSNGSVVTLPTMVCEIYNAFDLHSHEFGHMMGLKHPWNAAGMEYASPYDIMSAGRYGGTWPTHLRDETDGLPAGERLPKGTPGADPRYTPVPPQRVVGPLLSGAQVTRLPAFARFGIGNGVAGVVIDVGDRPQREDISTRLFALDHSRAKYPEQRLPAVVRTTGLDGYTYFVEIRRGGPRALYDRGVGERPSSPPEAVVLHHYDEVLGRMMYDGAVPLATAGSVPLDRLESEAGGIEVHVASVADDATWTDVVIGRHIPGLRQPAREATAIRPPDFPVEMNKPWPIGPPELGDLAAAALIAGASADKKSICDLERMTLAGLRESPEVVP